MESFLWGVNWFFFLTGAAFWTAIGCVVLVALWDWRGRTLAEAKKVATAARTREDWTECERWRQAVELHRKGQVNAALQLVGNRVLNYDPTQVEEHAA